MRIFITGASGFVGGAATRKLVAGGCEVAAMSRSERSDEAIRAMGATPVRCDLENVQAGHIDGADAVLHCAAFVEQWGPRDAWRRFNVDVRPRSLYRMRGEARHGWEHSIPPVENIRYSVTFRTLAFES